MVGLVNGHGWFRYFREMYRLFFSVISLQYYMHIHYFFTVFIFLFLFPVQSHSQETPSRTFKFEGYVLSDSLEYSAESIDYFFNDRKVVMDKNATILYLGRTLKSPNITFYQDYDYMEAAGSVDSTGAYTELPTFKDKTGEELQRNRNKI